MAFYRGEEGSVKFKNTAGTVAAVTSTRNWSLSVSKDVLDCTAQGDTGAFCVYGDHCACSEGFICGALDGSEGGGNAGECAYGEVCLPE